MEFYIDSGAGNAREENEGGPPRKRRSSFFSSSFVSESRKKERNEGCKKSPVFVEYRLLVLDTRCAISGDVFHRTIPECGSDGGAVKRPCAGLRTVFL